jgi:hypothetical protein
MVLWGYLQAFKLAIVENQQIFKFKSMYNSFLYKLHSWEVVNTAINSTLLKGKISAWTH